MSKKLSTSSNSIDWESIREKSPYPNEAFIFVQEGLEFTVQQVYGRELVDREPGSCHVTGEELCHGLRDYAIRKYGLMARSVLEHWNIARTEDFGRIVFAMVETGLWSQTDDDSMEDFRAVYSFDEAFAPHTVLEILSSVRRN
ncbi:MAG: Minf_1886 family protein [Planctomycetota bacterium]